MDQSKIAAVISPRERDIGGFSVRRLLPTIGRKTVGPFIFFDQMGPVEFAPGMGMDVRPHPHIGLATVTYLIEGEILHRDNLGTEQVIRPGDINWMTAGRGIVHSERTPSEARQKGSHAHGIQCWVALPREHEEIEPSFFHHPAKTLPELKIGDVAIRLLVGTAFGMKSPVQSLSDIMYLDVRMSEGSLLEVPAESRELAVFTVHGRVRIESEEFPPQSLIIGRVGQNLRIEAETNAHVMVIGGESFGERRHIWWNFVSSSKERIDKAAADWTEGRFAKIPGDDQEFIPLPDKQKKPEGTFM